MALLMVAHIANADVYNTGTNDSCTGVVSTTTGFIMIGYSGIPPFTDGYLMSMSNTMDTLWTKQLGDNNLTERVTDVVELPSGGFLVLLTRTDSNTGTAWLVKLTSSGVEEWSSELLWDPVTLYGGYTTDKISRVTPNAYVVSMFHNTTCCGYQPDSLTVDSFGQLLPPLSIPPLQDEQLFITDNSTFISGVDPMLNVLWTSYLDLTNISISGGTRCEYGGLIVAGTISTLGDDRFWATKFDSLGGSISVNVQSLATKSAYTISPNPNNGIFNIKPETDILSIHNAMGEVFTLPITNPGLYFVRHKYGVLRTIIY
jgi:hypothetical protein